MDKVDEQNNQNLIPYKPSSELIKRGIEDLIFLSNRTSRVLNVPLEYETIQSAVDASKPGDIIKISSGKYKLNLSIEKSIILRASEPDVELFPEMEGEPILSVENAGCKIIIENILFTCEKESPINKKVGIKILNGSVALINCKFSEFDVIPNGTLPDTEEFWENFIWSAIYIDGEKSELEMNNCEFRSCNTVITSKGGAHLIIANCDLNDCECGLSIDQSIVSLKKNNFFNVDYPFNISPFSSLYSNEDTFYKTGAFICGAHLHNNFLDFVHCTILSDVLLNLLLGDNEYYIDSQGSWNLQGSIVNLKDCILVLSTEEPSFRYARQYSGISDVSGKSVIFVIRAEGNNLFYIPPNYTQQWPNFSLRQNNRLTLLPDSPALQAASDGTNLGAWQG